MTGFEGAEAFAQQLGGHLATVDDAAENEFLARYLADLQNRVRTAYPNLDLRGSMAVAIIGLARQGEDGPFVWTSGDPVAFTHWASGMAVPQLAGHLAQGLRGAELGNGEWEDVQVNPSMPFHPYLLEFPGSWTQGELDAATDEFLRRPPMQHLQEQRHSESAGGTSPESPTRVQVHRWRAIRASGRDGRFHIGENYWGTTSADAD